MDYSNIIAEVGKQVHKEVGEPLNKMKESKAAAASANSSIVRTPAEQRAMESLQKNIAAVDELESSIDQTLKQVNAEMPAAESEASFGMGGKGSMGGRNAE